MDGSDQFAAKLGDRLIYETMGDIQPDGVSIALGGPLRSAIATKHDR